MSSPRRHWLVVVVVAFFLAKPCLAERVVLVRPIAGDLVLSEVFNRLQGELRMHGFETILASTTAGPSPNEMQRLAELGQATASIALERVELDLLAHVWFLERETSEARVMSIALAETEETPTLLALRTVELLRSGLRERSVPLARAKSSTAAPVPAKAKPPPPTAPPPEPQLDLRLEGSLLWSSLRQSALPALALSGGYRILEHWALAARFSAPLAANHLNATGASADYRVYFAGAESRWSVAVSHAFTLEPIVAVGLARCAVAGHGSYPVSGVEVSAWTMAAALGFGAWFAPAKRFRIGASLRLGALAPKPILRVDDRDEALGRPWLEMGLGVNYAL